MTAILILCAVVFVFGLVLRSVGLSMVRRAERDHQRMMSDHDPRWGGRDIYD